MLSSRYWCIDERFQFTSVFCVGGRGGYSSWQDHHHHNNNKWEGKGWRSTKAQGQNCTGEVKKNSAWNCPKQKKKNKKNHLHLFFQKKKNKKNQKQNQNKQTNKLLSILCSRLWTTQLTVGSYVVAVCEMKLWFTPRPCSHRTEIARTQTTL